MQKYFKKVKNWGRSCILKFTKWIHSENYTKRPTFTKKASPYEKTNWPAQLASLALLADGSHLKIVFSVYCCFFLTKKDVFDLQFFFSQNFMVNNYLNWKKLCLWTLQLKSIKCSHETVVKCGVLHYSSSVENCLKGSMLMMKFLKN